MNKKFLIPYKSQEIYRRFTILTAIKNSAIISALGRKPRMIFPGKIVVSSDGRPKKYRKYFALVIHHDNSRVPRVERIRITGKDPETKYSCIYRI